MRLYEAPQGTHVDELAKATLDGALADERCDRCGSHAYVVVSVPTALSSLFLCHAHWRLHQVSVTRLAGARVAYATFEALTRA